MCWTCVDHCREVISLSPVPLFDLRYSRFSFEGPEKTRPLAGVAHIAVAEPGDEQQERVIVTIDEDAINLQTVAGRFSLHPQLVARAAEERGKPGIDRAFQ